MTIPNEEQLRAHMDRWGIGVVYKLFMKGADTQTPVRIPRKVRLRKEVKRSWCLVEGIVHEYAHLLVCGEDPLDVARDEPWMWNCSAYVSAAISRWSKYSTRRGDTNELQTLAIETLVFEQLGCDREEFLAVLVPMILANGNVTNAVARKRALPRIRKYMDTPAIQETAARLLKILCTKPTKRR